MKKLISLFLALVMVFSLAMPAMATTVSGGTSKSVHATFDPDIAITDISFIGDTVTYDPDTNIYTVVIPAGAEAVEDVYGVTYGTNLKYIPADDETYLVKTYLYMGGELVTESELPFAIFVNDESGGYIYDETTGTLTQQVGASTDYVGDSYGFSFSNDGGLSWSETIYFVVKQAYAISVDTSITNGTVSAKTSAVEGETVELFVHAAEGYELQSLTVTDGEGNGVTVNEDHTFVMPAADVTVNATFVEAATAYTITVDDTIEGGFVTVNDNLTSAHEGDDITLTVTPYESWELVAVTVNDGAVEVHQVQGESDQYTFTMPAADVTVTATFKAVYGININVTGEGSVTADPSTAAEGETVTLTITPEDGYVLYYLEVDYEQVAVNGNTYTFTMPQGPVYVRAIFERTGKALETLYVKNTGSWETIYVYFYTDSGICGLDSANLTIVGGETDIYYTTAIPEFAYKVQIMYSDGTYTEIIDLPTDGELNQYNPDDGTWTKFEATERPTISANIAWGSMAFTFTDDNGWANDGSEGAGTVTVTNTGATAITATVEYTAVDSYSEIKGTFDAETANLVTDAYQTFTLTLSGEPEKAIPEGTTIGEVKVTIE